MTAAPERTAPAGTADLERDLRAALDGEVAFDDYTRHLFSQDASMYAMTPAGVVYPRHADDVVATVRLAGEAGLPVLARGAGTSLVGQTITPAVTSLYRTIRNSAAFVSLYAVSPNGSAFSSAGRATFCQISVGVTTGAGDGW